VSTTACVPSYALHGLQARPVEIVAEVTPGPSWLEVTGVGDLFRREISEYVRHALAMSGRSLPAGRIVVRVTPHAGSGGGGLGLPIALAILAAAGEIEVPAEVAVVGDLSLHGAVRGIRGALAIARAAHADGRTALVLPSGDLAAAVLHDGIALRGAGDLNEAIDAAADTQRDDRASVRVQEAPDLLDVDELHGLAPLVERIRSVVLIARRNVLLVGEPGSGTTMLARRIPSLLPELSYEQRIEATAIANAAGLGNRLVRRPFRAPHHATSLGGLIGRATADGLRPGELTFAHHGVLLIEDVPRWERSKLAGLSAAHDGQRVVLADHGHPGQSLPARTLIVGTIAPCACGQPAKRCRCTGTDNDPSNRRDRISAAARLLNAVALFLPSAAQIRAAAAGAGGTR
jgi:magnesium chelatase family protein